MAAFSSVWELSRTTNDLIGISTGFLQAATTDNVQPLALLACESFGATLPMSYETRKTVGALCSQGHQSQIIEHLKFQVGWRNGDSGWHLSRSDAGQRFLGLAACLLTFDQWSAAQTFQELIIATAADKLLVPTARQLQDLLTYLESRLGRSDFSTNVVGWQLHIDNMRRQSMRTHYAPSGAVTQKVVEALSSLQRLGDQRRHSLKIEIVHQEAAWVIALIKWLLGRPPNVEYGGSTPLLAGSQVTVIPCDEGFEGDTDDWDLDQRLQITVCDRFDNILELITAGDPNQDFIGLVPVTRLAESFVQYFGPQDSPRWLAAVDMISYGCSALLRHVRKGKDDKVSRLCHGLPGDTSVKTTAKYPFESDISETMARFLGLESTFMLKKHPPHYSEHIEAIQELQREFLDLEDDILVVKKCIATIFALSLFVPNPSLPPLSVLYESPGWTSRDGFERPRFLHERLWGILQDIDVAIDDRAGVDRERNDTSNNNFDASPRHLFQSALRLLGHQVSSAESLAMSSFSGQTVFPEILHSLELQHESRVRLFYMHGVSCGRVINTARSQRTIIRTVANAMMTWDC
ncbi:hypothetical protein EDD37DRAFT_201298 [Exophiala viscosa]|uniref:uncharacterized protein n=1 Tax=Exophiala viscosa TaxID=2486360 RepID=UPI00219392AD|nr:hypothetical protein EDD37DRAFT_201298 [Exophiala viscosa]